MIARRQTSVFPRTVAVLALAAAVAAAATAGSAAAAGPPPGRVVVYFDLTLTGPGGVAAAARALSSQADTLTRLGAVEVVVADPLPATVLAPTDDAAAVRAILGPLAGELPGAGALAALRRDFADEMRGAADDPQSLAGVAEDYLAEEEELLRRALGDLASWLVGAGGVGGGGARTLVLVADGFDFEPAAFYLGGRGGGTPSGGSAVRESHRRLADGLAAGGWRLVAVALGPAAVGLGDPAAPLVELAAATGGAVVARPEGLAGVLVLAEGPPLPSLPAVAPVDAVSGPGTPAPAAAPTEPPAPPRPTTILLLPPRGGDGGLTGKTRFQTLAVDPAIARAVFYLDGEEAAADDRAPFTATLDLGAPARPHTVRVVGYSAAGRALGEHALTVNQGAGAFRVAITRLTPVAGAGGEIEVEADVEVPAGTRLDRLEVFRNETLAARLTAPPFRTRIAVPGAGPQDYVRVVAVLADGRSLDDARLLAAPGPVERVEVNLVELFAVVTDADGNVVSDLGRDDFRVRQGKAERPIERFQLADEVPLMLGLLVDTSESMWVLMPDTKQAASKFLADTLTEVDRAFLVDFNTRPRLAQAATGDLLLLLRSFATLAAGGATALYDSVVFSLFQFEDVPGRRALVLLTDGDDYGSRFGPRRCAEYSRELGVPVYVVSLAGLYGDGRVLRKNDLEGIVGPSGGRIYYITRPEQLSEAYAQINAELRSQYVLAYATDRPLTADELRSIEVEVGRPGTTVRTVVGPNRPAP